MFRIEECTLKKKLYYISDYGRFGAFSYSENGVRRKYYRDIAIDLTNITKS